MQVEGKGGRAGPGRQAAQQHHKQHYKLVLMRRTKWRAGQFRRCDDDGRLSDTRAVSTQRIRVSTLDCTGVSVAQEAVVGNCKTTTRLASSVKFLLLAGPNYNIGA